MPGKRETRRLLDKPEVLDSYIKTAGNFFPALPKWISNIKDPRNPNLIIYQPIHMLILGLFLYLGRLETRRQLTFGLNTSVFARNFNALCAGNLETVAHHDTVEYFYCRLAPEELEDLRNKMVRALLRKRCLEKYRLFGLWHLVVIDGTGRLFFKDRHCEHCLSVKTSSGETRYFHKLVEAKLVTGTGLCFSLCTEFIENASAEETVQDCELKACYRLLDKLKRDFPQLSMCLLMDSLYVNEPVIDIMERNKWRYIINYKDGSARTISDDARSIFLENPGNVKKYWRDEGKDGEAEQNYRWSKNIEYKGHVLHHIRCEETKNGEETTYEWITNFEPDIANVNTIANEGGRCRWKIENEGFNIQKNGGYNLEHVFSTDNVASKNYYFLMQIAHMINQLVEHGSLLRSVIKTVYGSCWNLQKRLVEEMKYMPYEFPVFGRDRSYYIKLDTS